MFSLIPLADKHIKEEGMSPTVDWADSPGDEGDPCGR